MPREGFAHLHVHSEFSMLDGAARVHDLVQAVAADEQPARHLRLPRARDVDDVQAGLCVEDVEPVPVEAVDVRLLDEAVLRPIRRRRS